MTAFWMSQSPPILSSRGNFGRPRVQETVKK